MGEQLNLFDVEPASTGRPGKKIDLPPLEPAAVDEATLKLAESLPTTLYLGTSSWSFPGWERIVYNRTATKSELAKYGLWSYSRHPLFRSVGLDSTFYAPLPRQDFLAYAESVPTSFRFLVKALELCTLSRFPDHPRYGNRAGRQNHTFLDPAYATDVIVGPMLDGLRNKVGVLLFQFPPQDFGVIGGTEAFIDALHRFLDALPDGVLYSIELRNPEAMTKTYSAALADTGSCHCYNVHPRMPDLLEQAEIIDPRQSPGLVIRWMLGVDLDYDTAMKRYDPFDRLIDPDPRCRNKIATLCGEAAAKKLPTFVIANNKAEGSAPLSLLQLAEQVRRTVDRTSE